MSRPRAMVLAAPGTNRDHDVAFALQLAGADPHITLLEELLANPAVLLRDTQLLVLAGGFSYADALGAGRMWSLAVTHRLGDVLPRFVALGRPVIGICNGFQVLTRTGLLPGALGHNASGHFQCEWVRMEAPASKSVWTTALEPIECPIAHGGGATCTPTSQRWPPMARWPCATPTPSAAVTPTARRQASPACATRRASCWA